MRRTGAVLAAAGLSSRMKDFKPMLPFGGSTIAGHIVTMLKDMGISPVIVVTGYRAEELEAHLSYAGVRFVRNERYRETEMFDSVKLGLLETAATSWTEGGGSCAGRDRERGEKEEFWS